MKYSATVRGIMMEADGMPAEWLNTLARVVEALPADLCKEICRISMEHDGTEVWPPLTSDGSWYPGIFVWGDPAIFLRDESARKRLNEVFMRVDGGHPGIGWLFPDVPWVNGKPVDLPIDVLFSDEPWPERILLTPEEEVELWLPPVGWGAQARARSN